MTTGSTALRLLVTAALLAATFTCSQSTGFRGLAAMPVGAAIALVATTTQTSANSIVVCVDDFASTSPSGSVVATAPTKTVYRGLSLPPR